MLTWTASYEAYGKRTKETGTNQDKQRGNSKDEDPTGLLNEGFRYRDLETGVWLSRDPAGFVDGPNLYAYVKENPWSSFDAEGLITAGLILGHMVAEAGKQAASLPKAPVPPPVPHAGNLHAPRMGGNASAAIATTAALQITPATATTEGRNQAQQGANFVLEKGYVTPEQHAQLSKQINALNGPELGMYQGASAQTRNAIVEQGTQLVKDQMQVQYNQEVASINETAKTRATQNEGKTADPNFVVVRGRVAPPPPPGTMFSGSVGLDVVDAGRGVPNGQLHTTTAKTIIENGGTVVWVPEGCQQTIGI